VKKIETGKLSNRGFSTRRQRGSALISALALVGMSTLMLSGIAILSASHAERQRREADYALAMQMAEAGINYEMRYLTATSAAGHSSGSPYTGTVSVLPTSQQAYSKFTVYTDTANKQIISTGTVGDIASTTGINEGITRKVVLSYDSSIFDGEYALFATKSVTLSSNSVTGRIGCNTSSISGAATSSTKCPSRTDSYPTVDEVVTTCFGSSGWSSLTSTSAVASQCSRMRKFNGSSYWWSNQDLTPSGTSSCNWSHSGTPTCTDSQIAALPDDTLILPPGDYYFKNTDLVSGSGCKIICDNAAKSTGGTPGCVRIWVGCSSDSTSDNSDSFDIDMHCTSTDTTIAPRIFYGRSVDSSNRQCTLSCGGRTKTYNGSTIYSSGSGSSCSRGVYAVCQGKGSTATPPVVKLNSSCSLKGTCIADKITCSSSSATCKSQNIKNPTDPARPNAVVIGRWQEVAAATGSKVFIDGTNN